MVRPFVSWSGEGKLHCRPTTSLICFNLQVKFNRGVTLSHSAESFVVLGARIGVLLFRSVSRCHRITFVTLYPNMELPEFFMAPDESLMRLIPPGRSVFGSSSDEIESAIHLDRDGELFSLEGESPQFVAFLPPLIGVFAITNQQFVRFLSQTRPSSVVLNLWMPWRERIWSPEDDNAPYRVAAGFEKHPVQTSRGLARKPTAFGLGFDYRRKWNGKKRREEPTDKSFHGGIYGRPKSCAGTEVIYRLRIRRP